MKFTEFITNLTIENGCSSDQFLYRFTAIDSNDRLAIIRYSLIGSKDFFITPTDGSLYTQRTINYPKGIVIPLIIVATSSIGQQEELELMVTVIPRKPPKFSSNYYEITMNIKSLYKGLDVIKAEAEMTYSFLTVNYGLNMSGPEFLTIDKLSGIVKWNFPPPSDVQQVHAVINAYYQKTPEEKSFADLVIKLINSNDSKDNVQEIVDNERESGINIKEMMEKYDKCKMEKTVINGMELVWPETKIGENADIRCVIGIDLKQRSTTETMTTTTEDSRTPNNNYQYYYGPEHPITVRLPGTRTVSSRNPTSSTTPTTEDLYEVDQKDVCRITRSEIHAERACIMNEYNIPEWEPLSTTTCTNEDLNEINVGRELTSLMESTKLIIKYNENSSCNAIQAFAETVDELRRTVKIVPQSLIVARNITIVIGQLMNLNMSDINSIDSDGLLRNSLIDSVNIMLDTLPATHTSTSTISTENVFISVQMIDTKLLDTESFKVNLDFPGNRKQCGIQFHPPYRHNTPKLAPSSHVECLFIDIPKSALMQLTDPNGMVRVEYATLANNKLFGCGNYPQGNLCDTNIPVVIIRVGKMALHDLKEPIAFEIPVYSLLYEKQYYKCSSWDENGKYWSTNGLDTKHRRNTILCHSQHLSAFTVFYDPSSTSYASKLEPNTMHFVILSFSFVCIQILFCSLLHTKLRGKYSNKLLMNLLLSLLMVYFNMFAEPFITNLHPGYMKTACYILSLTSRISLLQYVIWTFIHALYLFRIFCLQEIIRSEKLSTKVLLLAYGIPILFGGANMILIQRNENETRCLMSAWNTYTYYSLYYIPISLLIIIDAFLCFKIIYTVQKLQKESQALSKNKTNPKFYVKIIGMVTICSLMGVSWIHGPLVALIDLKNWLDNFFSYINAAQGVFIFFVKFIYYKNIRQVWYATFCYYIRKFRHATPEPSVYCNQRIPQISLISAASTSDTGRNTSIIF